MITAQEYISAIKATGGWERFDRIMDGVAHASHSRTILDNNPEKAASLDFRITNYIRTRDYRSWLKIRKLVKGSINSHFK